MDDLQDGDSQIEDDYDEEADSDFDAENVNDEVGSASSEDEQEELDTTAQRKKRRKVEKLSVVEAEVDDQASGDEEVIGAHKKVRDRHRQKQKRKSEGQPVNAPSDDEEQGWRARTRAMREREKDEKKKNKLATTKGATIDVNKIWEEMNRPAGMAMPSEGAVSHPITNPGPLEPTSQTPADTVSLGNLPGKENTFNPESEEMVTIQESYIFAGKTFTREAKVPKSSLNKPRVISKESSHVLLVAVKEKVIRRPLRRTSRFDPNGNSDAFKKTWTTSAKIKKVNVLTKTAGDWEEHVEAMGDREALDEHAKGKEAYLSRRDFLQTVEQRREEEARLARLKG